MAGEEQKTIPGFDLERLGSLFLEVISLNVSDENVKWLKEKVEANSSIQFNTAFASVARRVGKALIKFTDEQLSNIETLRAKLYIKNWTVDRLCRVWLLMQIDATDETTYVNRIENLFVNAEMNELVALYSSLPVLAYPKSWRKRCAEGIRSNIGDVLTCIICKNPYPAENLDEAAWNQMVLKAFFTEKPIKEIIGLDERANQKLADTLIDYAHERWAANRTVDPQLWRCVSRFLNDSVLPDIERLALSENRVEREAAALVCRDSSYAGAKTLLNNNSELLSILNNRVLNWDNLGNN